MFPLRHGPSGVFMENSRRSQAPQIWWGSNSKHYHLFGRQQLKFQLSSFIIPAGFNAGILEVFMHAHFRNQPSVWGKRNSDMEILTLLLSFCHDIPAQFSAVLTILSIILQDLKSIRLWLTPELQPCSDTCVQWWPPSGEVPFTCGAHPVWLPSTNAQSPFEFRLVSVITQSLQMVVDLLQSL